MVGCTHMYSKRIKCLYAVDIWGYHYGIFYLRSMQWTLNINLQRMTWLIAPPTQRSFSHRHHVNLEIERYSPVVHRCWFHSEIWDLLIVHSSMHSGRRVLSENNLQPRCWRGQVFLETVRRPPGSVTQGETALSIPVCLIPATHTAELILSFSLSPIMQKNMIFNFTICAFNVYILTSLNNLHK